MENLQVTIETGKLQGIHGWDPRIAVFKGIPYAEMCIRDRLYGLVDVDSYLEKFNEELKAAGIDEIIAEEQKQFDAWLAVQ